MRKTKYLYFRVRNKMSFRCSRGFGIHSPFVFHLITEVFKDKYQYYAFDELEECKEVCSKKELEGYKLIYRLANHLHAKSIYINNSDKIGCRVLSGLGSGVQLRKSFLLTDVPDILVLDRVDIDYYERNKTAVNHVFSESQNTVVIKNMYKDDALYKMWSELKREAKVSIDLFNLGILFFDKKLQKGNYRLNI